MASRRSRFQIRPNLNRPAAAPSPLVSVQAADKEPTTEDIVVTDETDSPIIAPSASSSSEVSRTSIAEKDSENVAKDTSEGFVLPHEPNNRPTPHLSALLSSPSRRMRIRPALSVGALSPVKIMAINPEQERPETAAPAEESVSKQNRKKFTGLEQLDRSLFTMADLIYWNPKNDRKMSTSNFEKSIENVIKPGRKQLQVRQAADDDLQYSTDEEVREERDKKEKGKGKGKGKEKEKEKEKETKKGRGRRSKKSKEEKQEDIMAPQVKIGADGQLILDEASLQVEQTKKERGILETVEESSGPLGSSNRRISSRSFMKRRKLGSRAWTEEETDRFYLILSATGTDFGLMAEFFPRRTRGELKNKYRKESRCNASRVDTAMKTPVPLDPSLYESVLESPKKHQRKRRKLEAHLEKETGDGDESESGSESSSSSSSDDEEKQKSDEEDEDEEPAIYDTTVDKDREKLEQLFNRPSRYGRKRKAKVRDEEETETKTDDKKQKPKRSGSRVRLVQQVAETSAPPKGEPKKFTGFRPVRPRNSSSANDAQDLTIPISIPPGSEQIITLSPRVEEISEDRSNLVFVHEKSKVSGQPDMVHVYLLASPDRPIPLPPSPSSSAHPVEIEDVPANPRSPGEVSTISID